MEMTQKEIKEYCKKAAYFSVGEIKGKKAVVCPKTEIRYVSRREVAIEGEVVVVAEKDSFYGGDTSRSFRSKVLVNPTWGVLFGQFRLAMAKTLDVHHTFFEGVYPAREQPENGPKVYEFSAGS